MSPEDNTKYLIKPSKYLPKSTSNTKVNSQGIEYSSSYLPFKLHLPIYLMVIQTDADTPTLWLRDNEQEISIGITYYPYKNDSLASLDEFCDSHRTFFLENTVLEDVEITDTTIETLKNFLQAKYFEVSGKHDGITYKGYTPWAQSNTAYYHIAISGPQEKYDANIDKYKTAILNTLTEKMNN